ncbi:hypothetical protein LZ30DRAFT_473693 [Colletotrichum cereale]|nr:hypothetical protein LZ30DRAFT_473693 [Colletotrichum cereale]
MVQDATDWHHPYPKTEILHPHGSFVCATCGWSCLTGGKLSSDKDTIHPGSTQAHKTGLPSHMGPPRPSGASTSSRTSHPTTTPSYHPSFINASSHHHDGGRRIAPPKPRSSARRDPLTFCPPHGRRGRRTQKDLDNCFLLSAPCKLPVRCLADLINLTRTSRRCPAIANLILHKTAVFLDLARYLVYHRTPATRSIPPTHPPHANDTPSSLLLTSFACQS